MKLLYLITGLRLGGAEKQLALMAREKKKAGNSVLVVAMESGGYLRPEITAQGISVIELGVNSFFSLVSGYKKLSRIISQFRPDIIHAHMIHANLLSRAYKFFNPEIKLVNTAHNINEGKLLMNVYTLTKNIPDWSTNVSAEAYAHFLQQRYFNKATSSVIYNAIDTEAFTMKSPSPGTLTENSADRNFVFLFAGRLHPQKNIPMLIKAFSAANTRRKNIILFIAGDGEILESLREMTEESGVADRVLFLGKRDDIPDLMKTADCFVLPSIYEGFGMVAGEAMASGVPVIATDSGGVAEVLGAHGKLIKVNDVSGLTEAIIAQVDKRPPPEDLAAARTYICDRFGVSHIAEQWQQLYHQLL